MQNRKKISGKQNSWFDSQNVDDQDLNLEQDFNNTINQSVISNHIGTGLLKNSLVSTTFFDSSLLLGYLDGVALNPTTAIPVTDNAYDNIGTQLEIELLDSLASGRKSVKLMLVGLDFNNSLQYETFSFFKNEKQYTRKHYKSLLKIVINDLIGDPNISFNLGGTLLIKEAPMFSISRSPIMVSQDYQPNIFFRDFFVTGGGSIVNILQAALPTYDISTLGITTSYASLQSLVINDVTTQIGQKFQATTSNIQKITLLLSLQTTGTWGGDLVVSLYPLQTSVTSNFDIVPSSPINFTPSNVPVSQISFNYNTLLSSGYQLDTVPQPVDFIFSNTLSSTGNNLIVGNYYIITIRRSGAAASGQINVAVGNNLLTNSQMSIFDGTYWTDFPQSAIWFQTWTDAAKISDGEAYDEGVGIKLEKTKTDIYGNIVDNSLENLSFLNGDTFYAYVKNVIEQSNVVQSERTGENVYSEKTYVPSFSLLNSLQYSSLYQNALRPIILGTVSDKNVNYNYTSLINGYYHFSTFINDYLTLKIVPDNTYSSYDGYMSSLISAFESGLLNDAKFIVNANNTNTYYKVANVELIKRVFGDLNGDGLIDDNDLLIADTLIDYDITTAPINNDNYINITNPFISESGLTFTVNLTTGTDGVITPHPTDKSQAYLYSASTNFSLISNISIYNINIISAHPENNYAYYTILGLQNNNTLIIKKKYINNDIIEKVFCADLDDNGKIQTTDINNIANYINKTSPYPRVYPDLGSRVGTVFYLLRFKLEKFVDRDDEYDLGLGPTRSSSVHQVQDIFKLDSAALFPFIPSNNFATNPVKFSISPVLSWKADRIINITSNIASTAIFTENTGFVDNSKILLDVRNASSYPIKTTISKGVNDLYIPNNLIIEDNGELRRPNGDYYKVDLEIKNVILEIPPVSFDKEYNIDIFNNFISDIYGNGKTIIGFEAMKYADGTYVTPADLSKNRIRYNTSVQSFSPNLDGNDGYGISGVVVDGRVGVYMTDAGKLYLNFANLYKDISAQTLSTRVQVTIYLKKSGFNNSNSVLSYDKLQNILGVPGTPLIGNDGYIISGGGGGGGGGGGPISITLAGDANGPSNANIVTRIQGNNIATTSPTNGQALIWNSGTSKWEPTTISTGLTTITDVTSNYLSLPSDIYLSVNPITNGPFTIILPASPSVGQTIKIKNRTNSVIATTIAANAGQTIDGIATFIINTARAAIIVTFNSGTNDWEIS